MNSFFDDAFNYLMKDEGEKYTNDPDDSGGPTKFGITLRAYQGFKTDPTLTAKDIENLTLPQAEEFYYHIFWAPLQGDRIAIESVAISLFDSAVLYGPVTASLLLQKALDSLGFALKEDGLLGDKSIAALNGTQPQSLIKSFHSALTLHIDDVCRTYPKNEKYRDGWQARADRLLSLATP